MAYQESLARRFKPAGFEQPEGSRQNYTKPSPELQEAFYRWIEELPESLPSLDNLENQYQKAVKTLEDFKEIRAEESNSLLVDFKPKTKAQKEAGLFVSACYTHSPEETIIFDINTPEINCIGYKVKKNIFNNGKAGNWFAWESSGIAVNNGKCGGGFGSYSSGSIMNNGDCRIWFASESSGLAIAVKEPESYGWREKGKTLKPEDCERIPELKKYLDELAEITRNLKDEESTKRFLEMYGPKPKERIEQEIKEMLKKGGYQI